MANGIEAQVTRVTLRGRVHKLDVVQLNDRWYIHVDTGSRLDNRGYDDQQAAMEIACQWIDLNDRAHDLQHQAAELEAQASRLVAYPPVREAAS